jgi:hypothetical protein
MGQALRKREMIEVSELKAVFGQRVFKGCEGGIYTGKNIRPLTHAEQSFADGFIKQYKETEASEIASKQ